MVGCGFLEKDVCFLGWYEWVNGMRLKQYFGKYGGIDGIVRALDREVIFWRKSYYFKV